MFDHSFMKSCVTFITVSSKFNGIALNLSEHQQGLYIAKI